MRSPCRNAALAASVIACCSDGGICAETGAIPDPTMSFWASTACAVCPWTPALASSAPSTDPTEETRIDPSTEVPSTPPSWLAVVCSPPAIPLRATDTLPTIACVVEVTISPSASPMHTNQGHSAE